MTGFRLSLIATARFHEEDRVRKRSGYRFPGVVAAVFLNRKGEVRYVVEATDPDFEGMLHIFNEEQLEPDNKVSRDRRGGDVRAALHLLLATLWARIAGRRL